MTSATATLTEIAAFWRTARRLYTIYSELNRNFEIGLPLCADLEYPIDRSEPEVIERVSKWLEQMDERAQTWQLRQLLQSTNLQTEENLHALICRYLKKKNKTDGDRDKIDFLLVQYFAHCAPQGPSDQQIKLSNVGRVLEPVLGALPNKFPEWVKGLDGKLEVLNGCNSLEELQASNALVDVRDLKLSLGEGYLQAPALIAFTRFNFLARRAFFRAMHLDLHAIRAILNELESHGVTVVDCREAGLTQQESLEHIRHVIHQWKTPFRAPYSGGNSFQPLVALRHVLQNTLENSSKALKINELAANEPPAEANVSATKPQTLSDITEPPKAEAETAATVEAKPETVPGAVNGNDRAEEDSYLEECIGDITRQIMAAPAKNGASVTPIALAGCKLLIATWEADAFTKSADEHAATLQRAVAARTILHVCIERQKKHEATDLFVALEIAHLAVEEMRQEVARAKEAKNIDAAVSLAASTKRLMGLIAEGEKLCK